jgi:hypothetical protein
LVALRSLERISAILPRLLVLSLVLTLLGGTAAGAASPGETIILRCTHGQSLSGFSQQAYSEALKQMPSDTREYSECGREIRQAQLAAIGHGGGGGGGGSPVQAIAPTPSEQRSITRASHASLPVSVGGTIIHPGVVHADIASALSSLPTPLLAAIVFLLICLLALAAAAVRNHLRARHLN